MCNNNSNSNILFSLSIDRYNLPSGVHLAMYEEAEKWVRAFGCRNFMQGIAPNLADLVSGCETSHKCLESLKIFEWKCNVIHMLLKHFLCQ